MIKELDLDRINKEKNYILKKQDELKSKSEEALINIKNFTIDKTSEEIIENFESNTKFMKNDLNKFIDNNKEGLEEINSKFNRIEKELEENERLIEILENENNNLKAKQDSNITLFNEKINNFDPTNLKDIKLDFNSVEKFNSLWKIIMEIFFDLSSSNYNWNNMKKELAKHEGKFFKKKLKNFNPKMINHLDYSNLQAIMEFDKVLKEHVLNIEFHIFLEIISIILSIRKEYELYLENKNKLKNLTNEKKKIQNEKNLSQFKLKNKSELNNVLNEMNSIFNVLI